ncbi:MAG TPA: MmgE/PrpD family protein [Burkholderiaceae bacterium]
MKIESQLAEFVCTLQAEQVPAAAQRVLRHMLMAVCGTALAGAEEDGIAALRSLLRERGGAEQATTFVFGDRVPAASAARFNGTLCRALDYCDAMAPGPHIGSSLLPAALAAAELAGGCSGAEFVAALAAGAELSSRLNLSESQYDGFDPTGVLVVFAATAAAARILKLNTAQTLHALALAFNRCGGSFQSNVDGTLAVRMVQGWVAETGVDCAQLAQRGVTGPPNFIGGHYGYAHLYGRGRFDIDAVVRDLGNEWRLQRVVFKKYPSCGVTQGVTELALGLVHDEGLAPEQVQRALVRLPPYAHKLVGHAFRIGSNPRVDAQFNAGYCVANAIQRRASKLAHFAPARVQDAAVGALIQRIEVVSDESMNARGHTAVDLEVTTTAGRVLKRALDTAPGFPGADLTDAQHRARFDDCVDYAPHRPSAQQAQQLLAAIEGVGALGDARALAGLLVAPGRA